MTQFQKYWAEQSSSLHRYDTQAFYATKAREHHVFLSQAPLEKGVVDFGCGAGELLEMLYPLLNCPVIALDFSQKLLDIARDRNQGTDIQFELSDAHAYQVSEDFGSTWMSCGAINQYSTEAQMNAFIAKFNQHPSAKALYLFDCIDPVKYSYIKHHLLHHYTRPVSTNNKQFLTAFKSFAYAFSILKKNPLCVSINDMGYAFSMNYWHALKDQHPHWQVDIVSSFFSEYRYHVFITKA